MTFAQIIAYWPSWVGVAFLIICARWLRPTPTEYRWLGFGWIAFLVGLVAYGLFGCATLEDTPAPVRTNACGKKIPRHFNAREFPPACAEVGAAACYLNGEAWYKSIYPNRELVHHEEDGHGCGMVHTGWQPCGSSYCATVIKASPGYPLGATIQLTERGETVIPQQMGRIQPIAPEVLKRIFAETVKEAQ